MDTSVEVIELISDPVFIARFTASLLFMCSTTLWRWM